MIKVIYEGTTLGDPARRLLVDFWAFKAKSSWDGIKDDQQITAVTSLDFVNEVIKALVSRRAVPIQSLPWVADLDSYLVGLDEA
jgi:hypothetical protein